MPDETIQRRPRRLTPRETELDYVRFMREGIRMFHPEITEDEVDEKLREWMRWETCGEFDLLYPRENGPLPGHPASK